MEANHCNERLRPSEKAFGTTELFEAILLRLDLRTLLTSAQLVNRSWRQLIQNTTQIQRAMFFKPQTNWSGSSEPTFNPLLIESFPSIFPKDGGTSSMFSFKSLDMVKTPEKLAAYTRKEASWRTMLVQQPPVPEFALLELVHAMGGDDLQRYTFKGTESRCNNGERCLQMEALFACLLLSPQLCFRDFSTTKIGWSTKDFELPGRGLENDQAFEATMRQYRLVVYNRTIVQCSMNMYDKENEETVLRRRISDAYDGSFHHAEPDLYLSD